MEKEIKRIEDDKRLNISNLDIVRQDTLTLMKGRDYSFIQLKFEFDYYYCFYIYLGRIKYRLDNTEGTGFSYDIDALLYLKVDSCLVDYFVDYTVVREDMKTQTSSGPLWFNITEHFITCTMMYERARNVMDYLTKDLQDQIIKIKEK